MRGFIRTSLALAFLFTVVPAFSQNNDSTKAENLVRQAREAIGGEANLKAIQSLLIQGNLKGAMMGRPAQGELKIELMLPDKYLKTSPLPEGSLLQCVNGDQVWLDRKIPQMGMADGGMTGAGADSSGGGGRGGMGGGGMSAGGMGGGESGGMGGGMGGARGGMGGGRGGMGGGGRSGGMGGERRGGGFNSQGMEQMVRNDYNQMLIAWLLSPPAALNAAYSYEREIDSKNGKADVVRVAGSNNFTMWLFIDQASHRPLGYGYRAPAPRRPDITDAREAEVKFMDVQVLFDEYKQEGNVYFPHHIIKTANGQLLEEVKISKIKLNEKMKDKKFEKKS